MVRSVDRLLLVYAVGLSGSLFPGPFEDPFPRSGSRFDCLSGSTLAGQCFAKTNLRRSDCLGPGEVLPEAQLCRLSLSS